MAVTDAVASPTISKGQRPGWLIGLFSAATVLEIAAFALIVLVRQGLDEIKAGKTTLASLRSKFNWALGLSFFVFVLLLAISAVMIIICGSFLRYGIILLLSQLAVFGQILLLQNAIADAAIIVERTRNGSPAISTTGATAAAAISGVGMLLLLAATFLSIFDEREGRDEGMELFDVTGKSVTIGAAGATIAEENISVIAPAAASLQAPAAAVPAARVDPLQSASVQDFDVFCNFFVPTVA